MLIEISRSTCKQFNNFVSFEVKMHEIFVVVEKLNLKKIDSYGFQYGDQYKKAFLCLNAVQ